MGYYDTYSAIVSAVKEVAEDDSTEFSNYIPKAIQLAEMRLQDEVDLDSLNTQVSLACVVGSRLILKPSGYRFTDNIGIDTSNGYVPLRKAPTDYMRDYAPIVSSTGVPRYYATDYSPDYLYVVPTPSSTFTLQADMRVDVTPLSQTNPQNVLSIYCGNALFFATMKEQAAFMKNPEIEVEFENKYLNAVQGINNRGRRDRRQDGGSATTVESGKNTLLGTK